MGRWACRSGREPGANCGLGLNPASKIPQSVLVVIHTPALDVLLLERADHPGFWQSVTGSIEAPDEDLRAACMREVAEETGYDAAPQRFVDWNLIHRYPIYAEWLHRYAVGVAHNTEHVFGLCVDERYTPKLAPRE